MLNTPSKQFNRFETGEKNTEVAVFQFFQRFFLHTHKTTLSNQMKSRRHGCNIIRISWFQLTINGQLIKEQTDNYRLTARETNSISCRTSTAQASIIFLWVRGNTSIILTPSFGVWFFCAVCRCFFSLLFSIDQNIRTMNKAFNLNMHLLIPCNQHGWSHLLGLNLGLCAHI